LVEDYLRDLAEQQGLTREDGGFRLTPQAYRLFQGRLLDRIFSELQPSRTGRHPQAVVGEGAVELQHTKPYEFGDSITHMDVPQSLINAMVRGGPELPLRLKTEDIVVHRTRNTPKCATVVIMDMSGSMRYDAQYVNVKRMGLALNGLIRTEYPGDYLHFHRDVHVCQARPSGEIVELLPKPVTIFDPIGAVPRGHEPGRHQRVPSARALYQHPTRAAAFAAAVGGPGHADRQVILITDGLPTAHFDGAWLYLLYPPDPLTEAATMREGLLCQRSGITINIFSGSQLVAVRGGRPLRLPAGGIDPRARLLHRGRDLDRYVVWDYVKRRREIVA